MRQFVLASIAILGLAATAFAKDGPTPPRHAKLDERAEKRAALRAKFDANRDGRLDRTEKAAMREHRVEQRFARLDGNGDGVITLAEMKAARPAKHVHRKRGRKLVK